MMLLTMYFIPYMYIGPLWASKMWPEAEKCKNYWWANFLAVNNFIDVDNQVSSTVTTTSCVRELQIVILSHRDFIHHMDTRANKLILLKKKKNVWYWITWIDFYLHTFFNFQCLIAGWYISCLLQFIVIGTIIVYICVKKPKLGVGVMCLLLCVSLFIPFILTYTTRSYGIIRVLRP